MNGLIPFPKDPITSSLVNLFEGIGHEHPFRAMHKWVPPIDVEQEDGQLIASVELPGIDPEDVSVELNGDMLVISGEREAERENTMVRERAYGSFKRMIRVPKGIDPSSVSAGFSRGILRVCLPIGEIEDKSTKIEITTTD